MASLYLTLVRESDPPGSVPFIPGTRVYLTSDASRAMTPEEHREAYFADEYFGEEYREILGLEPPRVEGIFFRCGGCATQLRPEQSCFCKNPHPMWGVDAMFYGATFETPDHRRINPRDVSVVP